jgi:hypothetical protein
MGKGKGIMGKVLQFVCSTCCDTKNLRGLFTCGTYVFLITLTLTSPHFPTQPSRICLCSGSTLCFL